MAKKPAEQSAPRSVGVLDSYTVSTMYRSTKPHIVSMTQPIKVMIDPSVEDPEFIKAIAVMKDISSSPFLSLSQKRTEFDNTLET